MATYVNNLRLTELATGEGSGTWGTTTNTNLELIGQALGFGTRAIANASTDNITIADGVSDADRAMYLKLTGGGQACTVTILPNTTSKVWWMENATSYTLTFTCGSGANVAVLAGETKCISTDGLGSGGAVYDVLTDVNLAGTTKVDDLVVGDALTVGGTLGVTGVLTTTAATVFNGGFASNADSTLGTDKKVQFRDAAIYINSSADGQLDIVADTEIQIAATTVDINGAVDVSGTLGVTGAGTIDGTVIGGTTAAAGSFTTGAFSTQLTVNPTVDGDAAIIGKTTGQRLHVFSNAGALLLTNAAGAGAGRDGFQINDGTVITEIDTVPQLTITSGAATFSGVVTANAGVVVDNITIDGSDIISSGSLFLDSDDAAIYMSDGGTDIGLFSLASQELTIRNLVSDKDINFQGVDGGSNFTAFSLDMSEAGAATFNAGITATGLTVSAPSGDTPASIVTTTAGSFLEFTDGNTTAGRSPLVGAVTDDLAFYTSAGSYSPKMQVTAGGNVGIGIAPSAWNSGYKAMQLLTGALYGTSSRDTNLGANVFVNAGGGHAYIQSSFATNYTQFNGVHSWYAAPSGTAGDAISFTQAMTLDASGNLLVGKTATAFGTAGIEASASNGLWSTRSGLPALALNRLSTDGSIADFYKDGTTVGSIGTKSGNLMLGNAANPAYLKFGTNVLQPSTSAGADSDNTFNLGSSNNRFKDLYLSGGVYLGGAVAANLLDDYEEGTFTPTFAASGYTFAYLNQFGSYTKVGQMVSIKLFIRLSGVPTGSGAVGLSIGSLPFTILGGNASYSAGSILVEGSDNLFTGVPAIRSNPSVTYLTVYDVIAGSSPTSSIDCSKLDGDDEFEISIVYHAT
jgi:hypothetical protein